MTRPPDPVHPSRRGLLKTGVLGGALLFVGGSLSIALRSGQTSRAPRGSLRVLTGYDYAIFAAVAARVVPGDGAATGDGRAPGAAGAAGATSAAGANAAAWPSTDALDVAGKLDGLLAGLHPRAAREFRQLLHLFENGLTGLVAAGTLAPFTRASPAEQDRRLESWRRSRVALFRSGYQAMKRLAVAMYYTSPETYARVGYPGPPVVPQVPA